MSRTASCIFKVFSPLSVKPGPFHAVVVVVFKTFERCNLILGTSYKIKMEHTEISCVVLVTLPGCTWS